MTIGYLRTSPVQHLPNLLFEFSNYVSWSVNVNCLNELGDSTIQNFHRFRLKYAYRLSNDSGINHYTIPLIRSPFFDLVCARDAGLYRVMSDNEKSSTDGLKYYRVDNTCVW